MFGWTNPFRGYLGARKDLRRIARSLERIADHVEGKSPLRELPDHPRESVPVEVAYTPDKYYARAFQMEQRLFDTLGRMPTSEEVTRALDEEDAPVVVQKVPTQ